MDENIMGCVWNNTILYTGANGGDELNDVKLIITPCPSIEISSIPDEANIMQNYIKNTSKMVIWIPFVKLEVKIKFY
jgi:hypothetical protein